LAAAFRDELEQLGWAHLDRKFELEVTGDTQGTWDGVRLQQVLRNLVGNAINYGAADTPIHVVLTGDKTHVNIEVRNRGTAIEKEILNQIFDPLKRGVGKSDDDDSRAGLGLGLYIVREIAAAHGGEASVRSDKGETVFAVRLPRRDKDSAQ
jgi:signal transduction histidine kinase